MVETDVAIVGAGPTGLITAILLANLGHQVALVEKWAEPYDLPRATGITHEILRCLQIARLLDDVRPDILFTEDGSRRFEIWSGTGEVLTTRVDKATSVSGWPERASFSQPRFERSLSERARTHPNIRLFRGWNVVDVAEGGSSVTLDCVGWNRSRSGSLQVTAQYVIGCDGANSMVRSGDLAAVEDLGFAHDWLVVDVVLADGRVISPHLAQILGPPRPTTLVSGGPGNRRRWEFMRLDHESMDELNSEQAAWRLLAPFDVRPENATLERHAVYTFRGRWAVRWRSGRRLLAGDAAHLMPVFLGEGFNSGIRDAVALAWRLDLILRGVSTDALLDSYVDERLGHVRQVIERAVEAGKMICLLDPDLAAARNARLRADPDGLMPESTRRDWRLGAGVWRSRDANSGYLGVQGRVRVGGVVGLFDDVVGHRGFLLIGVDDDPGRYLSPKTRDCWRRIGGMSACVGQDTEIVDVDETYRAWFASRGVSVAIFRPDFYVFGTATSIGETEDLVSELLQQLEVARSEAPDS
jgi:2-polyprenyl-6-methoxyphenol hydroxylase-like FAD-dependent oxidoreductase